MFTKRFAVSTPQRKGPMSRQQSQKCASSAAIVRYFTILYTSDNLCNRLSAHFLNEILLFKEALPQSLAKSQIMTIYR